VCCTLLCMYGSYDLHYRDLFLQVNYLRYRTKWPRGLMCGSAAASLLGLRVRIPLVTWMDVSWVCCELGVSTTGWSLVQTSVAYLWVIEGTPKASLHSEDLLGYDGEKWKLPNVLVLMFLLFTLYMFQVFYLQSSGAPLHTGPHATTWKTINRNHTLTVTPTHPV
jgi:hypothetical protein